MSRTRVYGKAYPIKASDVKAYRHVDRRTALRSNPIGVTSMTVVNGRGAQRSREERLARARAVYSNGATMSNKAKKKSGAPKGKSAKKTSARRKVAGTSYFRTAGGKYQNSKGKFVKASAVKSARARTKPKTSTPKAKAKPKATRTATKRTATKRTATKRPAAKRPSATAKRTTAKRRRVAAASAAVPKTRRRRTSSKRATPSTKRVARASQPTTQRKASTVAAKRKGAGKGTSAKAKTPGSGKKKVSAKQRRAGKRLAAFRQARAAGSNKTKAKASALRSVPLKDGDTFLGTTKGGAKGTAKGRPKATRKKTKSKAKRKSTKRKMTSKRRTSKKRRSRAVGIVLKRGQSVSIRRNGRGAKRRAGGKKRKSAKRSASKPTKRKRGRPKSVTGINLKKGQTVTVRRNRRRRSYRRNDFGAKLKSVFATGLFVTTGFLAHRVITNLLCHQVFKPDAAAAPPQGFDFHKWKKPLVGLGVAVAGIPLVGAIAKNRSAEIGAGMVASLVQSTLFAVFSNSDEPNQDWIDAVGGLGAVRSGYRRVSRPVAHARRPSAMMRPSMVRSVRGNPLERHATSTMPRYQQISGPSWQQAAAGRWQQAAAGQFAQAAAGRVAQAAAGEYFSATGEYFVPAGVKGVGFYEPAGELALQPSRNTRNEMRDGIRPNANLDRVLDLAEAAAGVGDVSIEDVPTHSEWIPNGPLWAGEVDITTTQSESEAGAGILAMPGGNGILSG